MMTEYTHANHILVAMFAIGWQELVCCTFPLVFAAIVLLILFLTGVIGGKRKQ